MSNVEKKQQCEKKFRENNFKINLYKNSKLWLGNRMKKKNKEDYKPQRMINLKNKNYNKQKKKKR